MVMVIIYENYSFLKAIFSKKGGYVYVWGVIFIGVLFLTSLFFSMNWGYENIYRFVSILF